MIETDFVSWVLSFRGRRSLWRGLTYVALSVWTVVCLFPLYWVVVTTLKDPPAIIDGPVYLPFLDFRPSFDSWNYILFNPDDDTWRRYGNSLLVSIASTAITVALGGLAGYGLARLNLELSMRRIGVALGAILIGGIATAIAGLSWRLTLPATLALSAVILVGRSRKPGKTVGNEQITLAILSVRILPPVVAAVPIFVMAQSLGLVDSWSALIATYVATNLPIAVWLLRDIVDAVPRDLEEAAAIDGASRLRIIRNITLPLARGGVAAVALLIFVFCWNEYAFAIFLTTDHALTMPPFLAGQMAVREQLAGAEPQWGYFTVLMTLMVAPLALSVGLLQRLIARAFVGASSN
jgi:multiple sugar transport system permease protein